MTNAASAGTGGRMLSTLLRPAGPTQGIRIKHFGPVGTGRIDWNVADLGRFLGEEILQFVLETEQIMIINQQIIYIYLCSYENNMM